jgi:Uncharacterised protein family UPF0047
MHITASVFINDDESGLHHDYQAWPEKMAPHEPVSQYRHNDTGEENADAHIKRQIKGGSSGRGNRREAGLRDVEADLLRGVRWAEKEARAGEGHGQIAALMASYALSMWRRIKRHGLARAR